MTFALILTVEGKEAINNKLKDFNLKVNEERDFESESIDCIKAWRKNGGWLKDIPIYVHCPSKDIEFKTKEEYRKYNVTYIHHDISDISQFEYGFINVHYSGQLFSKLLKEDILIHIDLDMELLRPLDLTFFDPILKNGYSAIIGGYHKRDYFSQRVPIFGETILNTDLIITTNSFTFELYSTIINNCKNLNTDYNQLLGKTFRIYDIEEYGADQSYYQLKDKIFIRNDIVYEQGEGYSFLNIVPFFWHEHKSKKIKKDLFLYKRNLLRKLRGTK